MTTSIRRALARVLVLVGALLTIGAFVSVPLNSADASTTSTSSTHPFGSRVDYWASTRKGSPYQYGADGPTRFDCSGLTRWTMAKLGRSLPHSAARQYNDSDVHHIISRWRHTGDLVFFHNSGGIYHVGIYAGNGYIWHAPYSGAHVRLEKIWTSSVYYGRVK
jgi:cell wall-associated NlpC family hydrolase